VEQNPEAARGAWELAAQREAWQVPGLAAGPGRAGPSAQNKQFSAPEAATGTTKITAQNGGYLRGDVDQR